MDNGTLSKVQARALAKRYSKKYMTFWYVRQLGDKYEPWAHSSDDARTVATFYCGKEWKDEA